MILDAKKDNAVNDRVKRIELMCNINTGSMGENEGGKTLGFDLFLMECLKQGRMTVLEWLVRLQQIL